MNAVGQASRRQLAADQAQASEWSQLRTDCSRLAERPMTLAETGARILYACSRLPGVLSGKDGKFPISSIVGEGGESRINPDLLPLPVPTVPITSEQELCWLYPEGQPVTKEGFHLGVVSWLHLVIYALNQMYTGSATPSGRPPTEAQKKAIDLLYEDCGEFCRDGTSRSPTSWPEGYKSKADSYWGEPVYSATPLTLLQVLPTLPPRGVAASVDIMTILQGQIREQLKDPASLLLPEDRWPARPPKASTQLGPGEEWVPMANEIWQRDLVLWLPVEALFAPGGVPVISGLFGVEKPKEVPGHPGLQQLRLICNLIPSNAYFQEIRGDIDGLPYCLQWNAIVLLDDEVLLISQEDMSCAFYLFRLPSEWAKYFAIGQPIKLSELHGNAKARARSEAHCKGMSMSGIGYLCLVTLPMGWLSATGVMQAVHRQILVRPKGGGTPLPTAAEIRKSGVLPMGPDQRFDRGWQVYLDNFAGLSVVKARHLEGAQREIDRWHAATREAWKVHSIPSAADKSVSNSLQATELGCEVLGRRGTLGTIPQRRLAAIAMSLHLIGARNPHRMWLAMDAGCWNFIFQFRRQAACTYSAVWRLISHWKNCSMLSVEVCRELLTAIFLAPILIAKLRASPDLFITCSDASSSGAAVAGTAGLTQYGVESARSLPRSLPSAPAKGFAIVSLFAGIDALRRALDILGLRPVRHIAIEIESTATRNTAELYPDVVAFRDIRTFSRANLHVALSGVEVEFVIGMGGSPCQDRR